MRLLPDHLDSSSVAEGDNSESFLLEFYKRYKVMDQKLLNEMNIVVPGGLDLLLCATVWGTFNLKYF